MSNNVGDYNRGGMYAFVFAMVFTTVFFTYVSFIHPGIDLKEVTETVSGPATQTVAEEPADADISQVKDPWVSSAAMIAHGRAVFMTNCQMCHGPKGLGDGPAGKSLVPPPRNFVEGKWKKGGSEVDIFNVIANGIEGSSMVSFKHLPEKDRWALVHFIQSITHNKISKPDQLKEFVAHRK